jgi:ribonuclease P protein component
VIASVPGASNQEEKSKSKFPRSLRLLRHADFERVYKQGKRHFSASLTAFYLRREEKGEEVKAVRAKVPAAKGLRVGFTVGRALGGAVQRNRMKRRLREAVRLSHPPVEVNADMVINPKKSLLTVDFQAVLNEVQRAFVVVEKNCKENRAASSESRKPEAESRT